jgi:molybdopterin/thiamine biosynthesis adenylyltransferase
VSSENPDDWQATLLDTENAEDRRVLTELRADPRIDFIDGWALQDASRRGLTHYVAGVETTDGTHWAYYPWRRAVISVLAPQAFRAVRLDRNRNMITADEQDRMGALRIGVVGLSVGSSIAQIIAAEGLCGELRLSDFDHLELTNLNRVPATIFDLGANKAIVAARRIAELDPYLSLRVQTTGITPGNIADFLDGLDLLVEECDSLDMKVLLRQEARNLGIPVLMASSDRSLVDVERFDLEPQRPILHGLLGDVDLNRLSDLTSREKVPYVLRILDASRLSSRGAASLVEVGRTLSTWPQLSGDVAIGAAAVAEAIRRISRREPLSSGRVRIDVAGALDRLADPPMPALMEEASDEATPAELSDSSIANTVAAAANRAPSGGNAQPWSLEVVDDSLTIHLVTERPSTMDVGMRASAVAVGAAMFNARVAAAAHAVLGPVEFVENGDSPLNAVMHMQDRTDPDIAGLIRAMSSRETNRHSGKPCPITVETAELLQSAARREGARLHLAVDRESIHEAADVLAAADRIRYLTPHLHADMMSELRWPGDDSPETGIDVRSLELSHADLVTLDILRRDDVMAMLRSWDGGSGLGLDTHDRVCASAALAVITVTGATLSDYAKGGSAVESVWIVAQQQGLAVQPISPAFLYAQNDAELHRLSPTYPMSLGELQTRFRALARTEPGESQVLVLRLFDAPPASVRSRRRGFPGNGHRIR